MTRTVFLLALLASVPAALAQDNKQEQRPKIVVAAPLAIVAAAPVKLTLRGLNLNDVTEVKIMGLDSAIEIASKGKTAVPQNYDAKKVGDSVAEIKLTLPGDFNANSIQLVATSPAGSSAPYELVVAKPDELVEEKEPNDGFKTAQPIPVDKTIVGTIHDPRNVDVFELKATAGEKLVVIIRANVAGSLLDPILTLYDAAGQIVTGNDDVDGRDPKIETTVTKSGSYYLSIQDANDSGGPQFVYLLKVTH